MAKLAGITPNVVSRFSRGERDITLATADRIAHALGLALVRAAELPAERPTIDRRDFGAMMVWSIETGSKSDPSTGRRGASALLRGSDL